MRFYFLFFYGLCCLSFPCLAIPNNQTNTIPAVRVTTQKIASSTSGPQTFITDKQMQQAGITHLSQALQTLGGVQVEDMTGAGNQVLLSLRGFGANASSNILMLVNGIPITNPDSAPPDLNAIPTREIRYIEIIAGSESVLYGDQAVGGIINIVTKQHSPEKAALSCGAGSYNQYNCYVTLNQSNARTNYTINFLHGHSNNYRDHNRYNQDRLLGHLDYAYAIGRITFNYNIVNEVMQYPGALTAAQAHQNRRQANNNTDFFSDWNDLLQLRQQQNLNSDWRLDTQIALRQMQGHGVLSLPFQQNRDTQYLKPLFLGKIGHIHLLGGPEVEREAYHLSSDFGVTEVTQQQYGLFGLTNAPLVSGLNFSAGARGALQKSHLLETPTRNNNLNRALATTIGLNYSLREDTHLYLRRAESFRFPKADENAATPAGVNGLRTQRGVAYETGLQIDRETMSAKIGLYQLNLKDEIAFDPTQTPEDPFGMNRNLPPTVRRGLILAGKKYLSPTISLNGQYNYVDARFQNGLYAGKRIPLVSATILRAGINDQLTNHWNIYTEALFTGNQYSDNDNANIAGKIGGFMTYNLSLRYDYLNFSASLRINNLFNQYYYLYTVYQTNTNTSYFYPAPGRNFSLNLNYTFT